MIDLSELECTCLIHNISLGDKKVAEMLDISNEEAHALMDGIEECLDGALGEVWSSTH